MGLDFRLTQVCSSLEVKPVVRLKHSENLSRGKSFAKRFEKHAKLKRMTTSSKNRKWSLAELPGRHSDHCQNGPGIKPDAQLTSTSPLKAFKLTVVGVRLFVAQ